MNSWILDYIAWQRASACSRRNAEVHLLAFKVQPVEFKFEGTCETLRIPRENKERETQGFWVKVTAN